MRSRSRDALLAAPRRGAGPLALGLGALLLLSGCASLGIGGSATGTGQDPAPRAGSELVDRPEATASYDVLVGEMAARESRFEQAREALLRAAAKDPESAFIQRRLGVLSYQLEDAATALHHARRAVELAPDDEANRLLLGRLYRLHRDVDGAEEALLAPAAEGDTPVPVSFSAGLLLYQVYLDASLPDRALTVSESLLAMEPDELQGHMARATALERLGRLDEARAALREALARRPESLVLYGRLARLSRAAGDRAGEVGVYREVLEVSPRHYPTLSSLAEALIAMNDMDGALAVLDELTRHFPDDVQALRRAASLEYASGRYEAAADRLRAGLSRYPERYELAYSLGQVLRGAGRAMAAREAFASVPPSHHAYVDARLQLAGLYEDEGDLTGALEEMERVRKLRPSRSLDFHTASLRARSDDLAGAEALLESHLQGGREDAEVFYQLGVLYGSEKQIERSLEYMQRALEIDPDDAHALNYVGYTWAERGENLEEAEAMIRRALDQRPDDGFITDSLGWVYYMRARTLIGTSEDAAGRSLLQRAREQLSLAAELTGGDPVVSEHLGDVYRLLDQKERALEFYQEAVELDHREDEQPNLLEKLRELQLELDR